jgi:ankyrin repeat protein
MWSNGWWARGKANVDATNKNDNTPLNVAEKQEHKEIAEYLTKIIESAEQVSTEIVTIQGVPIAETDHVSETKLLGVELWEEIA